MSVPLSADQFISALRAEGVKVVEHRSWRTHNRNHMGPWGPVYGVVVHHTASSNTLGTVELCYEGRTDLSGPLCHGVVAKDGTVYLVGNGRANHAGAGDGDVLAAVQNERALPPDNESDTDGNRYFYGFEAINLGDGTDPWPREQVDAIVRASAALCRAHGWGQVGDTSVIGHLEWRPGKTDPRGITMDDVRTQVAERLRHDAGWSGDDMPSYLALGMTEPFTLGSGGWTPIAWDTEGSDVAEQHRDGAQVFATGGAQYNGAVWVYTEGLNAGVPLFVRLEYCDADDNTVKYAPFSGPAAPALEPARFAFPIVGSVPPGQRVKAAVYQNSGYPISVLRAELRAQVWA